MVPLSDWNSPLIVTCSFYAEAIAAKASNSKVVMKWMIFNMSDWFLLMIISNSE